MTRPPISPMDTRVSTDGAKSVIAQRVRRSLLMSGYSTTFAPAHTRTHGPNVGAQKETR